MYAILYRTVLSMMWNGETPHFWCSSTSVTPQQLV